MSQKLFIFNMILALCLFSPAIFASSGGGGGTTSKPSTSGSTSSGGTSAAGSNQSDSSGMPGKSGATLLKRDDGCEDGYKYDEYEGECVKDD